MTKKNCSIDIGTNSVRFLVTELKNDRLIILDKGGRITRLGEGVSGTGNLIPDASKRTLEYLRSLRNHILKFGEIHITVAATEAVRIAKNASPFLDETGKILETTPKILSAAEEAYLSFLGASDCMEKSDKTLFFDLGGGSTELIGVSAGTVKWNKSLKIGSVTAFEDFLKSDPPSPNEMNALKKHSIKVFKSSLLKSWQPDSVIGIAGTVTTLAAISLGLKQYNSDKVHKHVITITELKSIFERLSGITANERRNIPGVPPGREDIIVTGCLITLELLKLSNAKKFIVSDRGLLYGLAKEAFSSNSF
ncbi:MAG: hypothetical protein P9M03_04340 [Candidatus Theseobacter exili]|nr:hypothetical protein [Candidatus Theseobacter exili]